MVFSKMMNFVNEIRENPISTETTWGKRGIIFFTAEARPTVAIDLPVST